MKTKNTTTPPENDVSRYQYAQNVHKDMAIIAGMLTGIAADGIVSADEMHNFTSWFHSLGNKVVRHPYSEINNVITSAIANDDFTVDTARDIIWLCDKYISLNAGYDSLTTDKQSMLGIISGITIDGRINNAEIHFLDNWLQENQHLTTAWPYDELNSIITKILADGVITTDEKQEILAFCQAVSGMQMVDNTAAAKAITHYLHIDPVINIPGHTFCITGTSAKYKRSQLHQLIADAGGIVKDQITTTLHYLIVCSNKNQHWAYTCYGRKIEEVLHNRQQGASTVLAHEFDLLDTLNSYENKK